MSTLHQTSVPHTFFILSYAAQTNITPPFVTSLIIIKSNSKSSESTIFSSFLKLSFGEVHEIKKGYPIFQIEIYEPYSDINGGQQIRRARGLVRSNRYINP